MKSSRKSTTTATTVTYTFHNDHITPTTTTQIPINSNSSSATPVHQVRLPPQFDSVAATTIQAQYRAHLIRKLYKTMSSVKSQADALQKLIQRQETVDAVRSDEKEKLRMNEALMGLLLRLDSVPGVNPTVREARRKLSRRIVELQEILDGICDAKMGSDCYYHVDHLLEWSPCCNFDQMMEQMEAQVCEESGGGQEMERFCAHYLGFRCLQRFLRQ